MSAMAEASTNPGPGSGSGHTGGLSPFEPGSGLRPAARRRRGFALTPLADVMFQLLLFFMLTSALAPYALLPLGAPAQPGGQGQAEATRPPAAETPDPPPDASRVVWHLGRGELRAGSARITLDLVPRALEDLRDAGLSDLVVFVTSTAHTADLTALVEAVRAARIAQLQLIGG